MILPILQQAVQLWYTVTGCPTERFGRSFSNDEYHLQTEAAQVAQMLELDDTGMSAFMLLRAFFEERLKETNFNAWDLLTKKGETRLKLAELEDLRDLLDHPDVVEGIKAFNENLEQALRQYGADTDPDWFGNNIAMAGIRRDAVLGINKLKAYQFLQGEPASEPLRFNPGIYEFWNIPSLIRAMQHQRVPGISVCLIRDPDAFRSFFVFAISNGDNMTILTDKSRDSHPGRKDTRRKPEREYLKRANRYHFPYELTEVKIKGEIDADGNEVNHSRKVERTGIVPYQTETVRLAEIKDLHPETVLWLAMMFDLILDKYGKQVYKLPELSYTAHMVREPEALVSANTSLVQSGTYKPLIVPDLTLADLTDEKLADNWRIKPTEQNDWMVARYAAQVPAGVYNLLGDKERDALLLGSVVEHPVLAQSQDFFRNELGVQLKTHDPLDFGSAEELEKDRVWTARYNQMQVIQRLAEDDFTKTEDKILGRKVDSYKRVKPIGWYAERVRKNAPFLLDAVARGELISTARVPGHLLHMGEKDTPEGHARNLLEYDTKRWDMGAMFLGDWVGSGYTCAVNGVATDNKCHIVPKVAADLALICGCEVKDLPWQLRNWTAEHQANGNSILDRMDPKDWVLRNPWRKLRLAVRVGMSQSGYNDLRKKQGLPRQPFPTNPWK